MSTTFHYKYPFLFYGERALASIIEEIPLDNLRNLISNIVSRKAWDRVSDDPLNIMLTVAILQRLQAKRLLSRYAVRLSKKIGSEIQRESTETVLNVARKIIDNRINVEDIQLRGVKTSLFKIPVPTYLRISQYFKSIKWKLVNQIVINGYVYVGRRDLIRLIEEMLKDAIINERIRLKLPDHIDLSDEYRRISQIERTFTEKIKMPKGKIRVDAFPPCMRELLSRAREGRNLSHTERFSLATFLFSLGMSIDDVNEIFSNLPDYDARKTMYQLRHLKGLVGSGTKYSPPSCKKLRFYGICIRGEECKDITHPLQYYLRNVKRRHREKR
ncbi:hypothetical protein DRO02_01665 [archaeon]|nr:MAG: hypothetical protein DRO02_01665 [archaeon]RLG65691.1 MAG: hypothetical protein DRO21_01320 [archaeon]HDM23564.1 hypothetical protein [Candidatus Bathyarchaeota archaeon]